MSNTLNVSIISDNKLCVDNDIFRRDHVLKTQWLGNSNWMDTNIEWYEKSKANGINLFTSDLLPPEKADIVYYFDLPRDYNKLKQLKSKAPDAIHILWLVESPLLAYYFDKRNHAEFDFIFTYNGKLVDNKRYFYMPIVNSYPPPIKEEHAWEDRKTSIVLNSNYYNLDIRASKTPLHFYYDFYQLYKKGWHFNIWNVLERQKNELYSERRKCVKKFLNYDSDMIDVYGVGWEGRNLGWYYKWFPDTGAYTNESKRWIGEKLDLLAKYKFVVAFENYKGDVGYVSEKIFDAMYAGTVPIYMGDKSMLKFIDSGAYIDAGKFSSYKKLAQYISSMPKDEWQNYRERIKFYTKSKEIETFLPNTFADTFIKNINTITNRK